MCITIEICWDNFFLSIAHNSFQWTISSVSDCSTDVVIFSLNKKFQFMDWLYRSKHHLRLCLIVQWVQ
jgi:hypothetical protein